MPDLFVKKRGGLIRKEPFPLPTLRAVIVFALVFFSCSAKDTPPVLAVREGYVSFGEKAVEQAVIFFGEKGLAVPDTKINPDGSASALRPDGGELAHFYWFEPGVWIAVIPGGFYALPSGRVSDAALRIAVKTKNEEFVLNQFSAFFFRPDLVDAFVRGEKAEAPFTLDSLFAENLRPPELSLSEIEGNKILLKVKTDAEGGFLAFWGAEENGSARELLSVIDLEKIAKKYTENDFFFYEAENWPPEISALPFSAVSVFNGERTLESDRLRVNGQTDSGTVSISASTENPRPVLRVLFAGNFSAEAAAFFSGQEQGGLYSKVEIYRTNAETGGDFSEVFAKASSETEEEDVFVCFLSLPVSSGAMGDYSFSYANDHSINSGSAGIPGEGNSWDFIEKFLSLKSRRSFLFVDAEGMSAAEEETAFVRLGQLLGLKTMLANFSSIGFENETEKPGAESGAGETNAGTFTLQVSETGGRYVDAGDFVSFFQDKFSPASDKLSFFPGDDFHFLDTHSGCGEIKMQTMFSGMVWISDVEEAPSVLTFGETLRRRVPAGSYSVTMVYRNGHRETKKTDVGYNTSNWVIFNYTPELLEGDFSRLPAFGVNIAELNPGNYKNTNPAVLKAMEVPEWQIAFLAGEELYRGGSYDRAVAEYSKSISLKGDYASSYVSRGNAYRKKGEAGRAIEDYTRALRLKPDYAEIYNYRGYLYSQAGDTARALSDYTQAIKFRKDYADALFNRAYVYGKNENWNAAIEDYSRVLALEPNNASAYRERGRALRNIGDEEKAAADFERAENINTK